MASPGMTHEDFAELYARQKDTTVAALVKGGMACTPCACGANYCLGWKAYWQATGREDHGDPKKAVEAQLRHQERWHRRGWS